MIEDKIKNKYRKLLPILPGLLTPSEVASEIVRPEIGLQVNRGSIPGLQKHNNINIHEIGGDTAWKPNSHDHYNNKVNNHESHTSYLEERVMHLEQSNQRLSQALYSLSSRVSSVETFNSCHHHHHLPNFQIPNRPTTSKSALVENLGISSSSLMEAMKISNELISELSQRVRKSELAIDGFDFRKPHQVK